MQKTLNLFIGAALLAAVSHVRADELPSEGLLRLATLFSPECMAIPYEPVPVYDEAGGVRIGYLMLDKPELAKETQASCTYRPKVFFQADGQTTRWPVMIGEVSYEEPALAIFKRRELNGEAWYQGSLERTKFWVNSNTAPGARYSDYAKDLVQGVIRIAETCDQLGRCQPTTQAFQKLADRAGAERQETCYGNAYEFVGATPTIVTLENGRKAYRVTLATELVGMYGDRLPKTLTVPVVDYSGKWSGFFYARGC